VGLLVARYIDELSRTGIASSLPFHTALGALGRHVSQSSPDRYQPSNVTWALIEDVVGQVKKAEKRERQVELAIATVRQIALECGSHAAAL
jgi:folate-dependent tRNA-U54 methylase TrmFO/GidA